MTAQTPVNCRAITLAASDPDWRFGAACRDENPELFFPVGSGPTAQQQAEEAKGVCHRCPVQAECLEWALGTGQPAGVWGGRDEFERAALVRPKTMHLDWCLAHQELIEDRRARGVSWRLLAGELGVRVDTVRHAVQVFAADRALAEAAQMDVASEEVSA